MTGTSGRDIGPLIGRGLTRDTPTLPLPPNCFPRHSAGRWIPQAYAQRQALWEIPFRIPERRKRFPLSPKTGAGMETHPPFRLPRIPERPQRLQKLSLQKARRFLRHDKKVGDASCLAGRSGTGGCVSENARRQTELRPAQTDNRAFPRRSRSAPWPALCAYARAVPSYSFRAEQETDR